MKSLHALIIAAAGLVAGSGGCAADKTIQPDIIITALEHHIGDDAGNEGATFTRNFDVRFSFSTATLSLTFVYPNSAGSGPEIDAPPEIIINGTKVGTASADFPDNPACISVDREYICELTLDYDVTERIEKGRNTVLIKSKGAAYEGDDDFVFTDVIIRFQ